jgi:acetylornithine deacetylase/succinyl-diaminopimelate desuccinylase-like protein
MTNLGEESREDEMTEMSRRAELVVERTIELAAIPAPTGEEADRARQVARWWNEDGVADVSVDEAGNLWGGAVNGDGGALIVAAHLDTVFSRTVDHVTRRDATRLFGPGVGDDTVAVAALSVIGQMLAESSLDRSVWLVATVGEEGLGNLRGANWALDHAPCRVDAFIALEGNYLGRIGAKAVGSVRWNVEVSGPGGHAWEAASAPSALDVAARMVASLGDVTVEAGQRSVNVGTFAGGEAVNARALRASFVIDMRAVDPAELDQLEAECRNIVLTPQAEGVAVAIEEIGRRPAGSIDAQHPLVRVARETLERHGLTPVVIASSTDANAAHPRGIPAVALGITFGEGEHTSKEWIDLEFIATGLRALADTVIGYASEVENDQS